MHSVPCEFCSLRQRWSLLERALLASKQKGKLFKPIHSTRIQDVSGDCSGIKIIKYNTKSVDRTTSNTCVQVRFLFDQKAVERMVTTGTFRQNYRPCQKRIVSVGVRITQFFCYKSNNTETHNTGEIVTLFRWSCQLKNLSANTHMLAETPLWW